jgi:hypothetical protein
MKNCRDLYNTYMKVQAIIFLNHLENDKSANYIRKYMKGYSSRPCIIPNRPGIRKVRKIRMNLLSAFCSAKGHKK